MGESMRRWTFRVIDMGESTYDGTHIGMGLYEVFEVDGRPVCYRDGGLDLRAGRRRDEATTDAALSRLQLQIELARAAAAAPVLQLNDIRGNGFDQPTNEEQLVEAGFW